MSAQVRDTVADFVCREILFGDQDRMPGPGDPLLGSGGVIDSVGLHQLITFLESQFSIEIGDLDIVPENFATLDAVSGLVARKQGK